MAAPRPGCVVQGAPKIQFMVRSENAKVIDFYTHLGYVPQYVQVLGRRLD